MLVLAFLVGIKRGRHGDRPGSACNRCSVVLHDASRIFVRRHAGVRDALAVW